jgi:Putative sensor
MSRDINMYLDELRRALAGADPAVIHDALYDAEEHLRSEFAAAQAAHAAEPAAPFDAAVTVAAIIEAYGTPQEVAAAYLEAEGLSATAGAVASPTGPATADSAALRAAQPAGIVATADSAGPGSVLPTASAAGATVVPMPAPAAPPLPATPAAANSDSWPSFFGVLKDQRMWLSLIYLLVTFGTGIAYFTWVVTGVSLSLGLAVLIIGIPFALFFLASVRGISFVEGRMVEGLLGVRMPRRPSFGPTDPSVEKRILYWLRDRRTWTTMLYLLLQMPLGIAYFVIMVTGFTTSLALIVSPAVYAVGRSQEWTDRFGSVQYWTVNGYPLPPWTLVLAVLAGVLLLFGTLHLIRLLGRLHGGYAKAMLVRIGQEPVGAPAQTPPPAPTASGMGGVGGSVATTTGGGGAATLSAPLPQIGGVLASIDCLRPSGGPDLGGVRWMPIEGDAKAMWRFR